MASAELALFGGFQARLATGEAIAIPGQKDRALLAILALSPGVAHSRDKLASLLWSDRGDQQARDSLKHTLVRLRQCLHPVDPPPIIADRQSVRLDSAGLDIDVANFQRLLVEQTPGSFEKAAALYRGELLEGIGVRDAAFEDWLTKERQRLQQLAEDALMKLLTQALSQGRRDRAAATARRLISLDPLHEAACRALMQLHAERSDTTVALKLYESLRDRLQRELSVKPEVETTRLYEKIRQGRAMPALTPAPAGGASAVQPVELSLPSKPSIAVLAFQNLSGDPDQEYFADGIVEEIITALSRFRSLFVIDRGSSFTYKGRAVQAKKIGEELGVRYVLQGSVRKSGDRLRIAGQLIDAATGANLWADRFEGGHEDLFALQDQVTASVVGSIAPKLEQAEIERVKRKATESLDAYDCYLRGMAGVHRWEREANAEALRMFYRAIELDPDFAAAYGMAARCYSQRKASAWVENRRGEIAETNRLARRAIELGKDDAVALCTAGIALAFVVGERDEGGMLLDRALELNPNWAWAWLFSGWNKVWQGEPDSAIEQLTRAMRLSPHDPQIVNAYAATASAHFFAGRYAEAVDWARRSMSEQPNHFIATCMAAASCALAGQAIDAQKAMARLRQLDPTLRGANLKDLFPIRRPEDFAVWAKGMRLAGLPE
jgi:TolB-like protein/DNA-binding SARP family transcriptional activator/Tfp pilus assembly protein PilF